MKVEMSRRVNRMNDLLKDRDEYYAPDKYGTEPSMHKFMPRSGDEVGPVWLMMVITMVTMVMIIIVVVVVDGDDIVIIIIIDGYDGDYYYCCCCCCYG